MKTIPLCVCAILVGAALAGENSNGKVLPELSVDVKAAEIIAGLEENTGTLLPDARIVGEFGPIAKSFRLDTRGPNARDFSVKMAWAPDRKRAFFCGGNHGVPHKLDDVWEYDLAANAWICQWDPDYNSRYGPGEKGNSKTEYNEDDILVTSKGGLIVNAHTWWGLTYDPERKAMLWMGRGGYKGEGAGRGWPLMCAFYPYEGKWRPSRVPVDKGSFDVPGQALEYIPDLKGAIWWANRTGDGKMYLLDSATDKCTKVNSKGGKGQYPAGYDAVMAYDTENKVLVAQGGADSRTSTFHFDLRTLTWSRVGEEKGIPGAHDKHTLLGYDPVGKVCLMVDLPTASIWAHSVKDKTWKKLEIKGVPFAQGLWHPIGYFDPERNVFVLAAGTKVWVYRNKKQESK